MMLTGQSDVCTKNSVLLPVAYRTQFKILTVTFKALYLTLGIQQWSTEICTWGKEIQFYLIDFYLQHIFQKNNKSRTGGRKRKKKERITEKGNWTGKEKKKKSYTKGFFF